MLNVESLKELFEAHPGETTLNIQGKCIACERNLTVKICPTTDGFGFKGGMLLDKDQQISCVNCIHTAPHAIRNTPDQPNLPLKSA
ncbi:MAG: hypothetical protein ABFS43_17765 [Thermodesulfobacteriota bacterium]